MDFAALSVSFSPCILNMAWNPADVDYFTLTGNIIIIVHFDIEVKGQSHTEFMTVTHRTMVIHAQA